MDDKTATIEGWITRDVNGPGLYGKYRIHNEKPTKKIHACWFSHYSIAIDSIIFHKLQKQIRLRPGGGPLQIKITLELK